jgi:two-component sensor histidine kinase
VAVAALRAGAADYVIKDVSEDFTALLRAAIEDALVRRRLERENQQAVNDVREARDRAEALLREVNHRVGNSLQLVSSFISLQQRHLKDEGSRHALLEAQSRIEAVAQVHRRLYTSADIATVGVADYLQGLIDELAKSLGPAQEAPQILVDVQNLKVTPDQAVSLGVIVTELITNAVKYAYQPGEGGQIRVSLSATEDGQALLVVEDDGPGMTEDAPKGTGLGTRIIKAMAQGLKSHLEVDPVHRGVRACLKFDL